MIKTIIKATSEDLDVAVNDFMATKARNLPVRTECFLLEGLVYHKATIFWDEDMSPKRSVNLDTGAIEEEVIFREPKKKSNKRGSLWIQQNGNVTGNFIDENDQEIKIALPQKARDQLKNEGKIGLKIRGIDVRCIANQFKKTAQHPDFVILEVKNDEMTL